MCRRRYRLTGPVRPRRVRDGRGARRPRLAPFCVGGRRPPASPGTMRRVLDSFQVRPLLSAAERELFWLVFWGMSIICMVALAGLALRLG